MRKMKSPKMRRSGRSVLRIDPSAELPVPFESKRTPFSSSRFSNSI
jgi:hypothetical protein